MPIIELDESVQPVEVDGFRFALGVYPVEPMTPLGGYVQEFEQADGGTQFWSSSADAPTGEDFEEWPDRFMYDILVPADRLPTLARAIFSMLPSHVYPILDVLGHDAYREVDPYIAYEQVGLDRVFDAIRSFAPWLYEDGLVGFGAMSLEPFLYVFIDEHKVLTVRAELELKDQVERALAAFGLEQVQEIHGPDSAAHEHRTILVPPSKMSANAMTAEAIIDRLRRLWNLQLNIDRQANLDDDGNSLGKTCWRILLRCILDEEALQDESSSDTPVSLELFAEILLVASNIEEAESIAIDQAESVAPEPGFRDIEAVELDRLTPEFAAQLMKSEPPSLADIAVLRFGWIKPPESES